MTEMGALVAPILFWLPPFGGDKLQLQPYDVHFVFIAPVLPERGNS